MFLGFNMNYKFSNTSYLQTGNYMQREIYRVLNEMKIFEYLIDYSPILVGTYPIDINVEGSDLDIICEVYDFEDFVNRCDNYYSKYEDYKITSSFDGGKQIVVINFIHEGYPIELFGESKSTILQNGYKHMVVEDRIMTLFGSAFKSEVVALKNMGYKTEPAFGKILGLEFPYKELLLLYELNDHVLYERLTDVGDEDTDEEDY